MRTAAIARMVRVVMPGQYYCSFHRFAYIRLHIFDHRNSTNLSNGTYLDVLPLPIVFISHCILGSYVRAKWFSQKKYSCIKHTTHLFRLSSLFFIVRCFFSFCHQQSSNQRDRPTDQQNSNINTHERTAKNNSKRNGRNETKHAYSGNNSKSNHTHTLTMFKNITKSVFVYFFFFRWRFGHRPLAERYSVSFSVVWSVGRSFVRSCVFFGFCFRLKLFMNDKKWWNFVLGNLKLCWCVSECLCMLTG